MTFAIGSHFRWQMSLSGIGNAVACSAQHNVFLIENWTLYETCREMRSANWTKIIILSLLFVFNEFSFLPNLTRFVSFHFSLCAALLLCDTNATPTCMRKHIGMKRICDDKCDMKMPRMRREGLHDRVDSIQFSFRLPELIIPANRFNASVQIMIIHTEINEITFKYVIVIMGSVWYSVCTMRVHNM